MNTSLLSRIFRTALFTIALGASHVALAGKPYQHFVVGDGSNVNLPKPATSSLVLMRGGLGVDVETALLVENGQARRVGLGSVYFLQTVGLPQVCAPTTPLTYRNLGVQRLSGTGSFDLNNWAGYGSTTNYSISAVQGVLSSTQPGGSVY